jgi:hypothetical protein
MHEADAQPLRRGRTVIPDRPCVDPDLAAIRAWISPARRSRLAEVSARIAPKDFEMSVS